MPEDAFEPDDDSLRRLDELVVRATPFLTARANWDIDYEGYFDFSSRLGAGGATPREPSQPPQLLGHATNEQGEDPAQAGPWRFPNIEEDEWCTLVNLPSHPNMQFGDGGSLAILIPYQDLAAGRYDRLATDQSMG